MCGILITVGGNRAFAHRDLNPLRRRGPDGVGFWTDGIVSMAQTRLSVLGLDERSQPPLANDRYVLVFNGEVYNFLDIARRLNVVATNDTQVLLDAWTKIGPSVLPMLEGFWAFAVYDREKREVTLVRDQFGIKPLYYAMQHGALVASSVLQPLLDCLPEKPSLNYRAMSEWAKYQLSLGCSTFHRGVVKLLPGHTVTYDVYARTLREREPYERIWDIRGDVQPDEYWVDSTRDLLRQCVDAAATSDTPITSTCSGGLDSSLVTRILAPEHAYHANFTNPKMNETQWAKAVVEGTETKLMVVNAREDFDLVERVEKIVEDFDELTVGSVILPLEDLFEQVARRYKVILLGTGGDELFGGYVRYQMALGETPQESYKDAFGKLKGGTAWQRFEQTHVKGDPSLYTFYQEPGFPWEASTMENMLRFDREHFLGGLLSIDDKMAGRHGLEGRPPLLHQRFVRRVLELDPKVHRNKVVLRQIARGILPDSVINRTDKNGFTVPIGTFVNANASKIRESLSSSPYRDLYSLRRLSFTVDNEYDRRIFGLVELDAWLRRYG